MGGSAVREGCGWIGLTLVDFDACCLRIVESELGCEKR